jgi:hypothetical protein
MNRHNKALLLVPCFLFASCAYRPIENFRWQKVHEPSDRIVFIKSQNPDKECRSLGAKVKFAQIIFACALYTKKVCFIVTAYHEKDIPSYIKAHEEMHCMGWIHE